MYAIIFISPGNPVEVKTFPTVNTAYAEFDQIELNKYTPEAQLVSLGNVNTVEKMKVLSDGAEQTEINLLDK